MNKEKSKEVFIRRWLVCWGLYAISYSTGAFLYGVLEWDNLFHYPILIISVILFALIFMRYTSERKRKK